MLKLVQSVSARRLLCSISSHRKTQKFVDSGWRVRRARVMPSTSGRVATLSIFKANSRILALCSKPSCCQRDVALESRCWVDSTIRLQNPVDPLTNKPRLTYGTQNMSYCAIYGQKCRQNRRFLIKQKTRSFRTTKGYTEIKCVLDWQRAYKVEFSVILKPAPPFFFLHSPAPSWRRR